MSIPCIVDQDVEPAECLDGVIDRRLRRSRIGHVEREGPHLFAVSRRQLRKTLRIARGRNHAVPGLQDRVQDCAAKAARAARDQPNLRHPISLHL